MVASGACPAVTLAPSGCGPVFAQTARAATGVGRSPCRSRAVAAAVERYRCRAHALRSGARIAAGLAAHTLELLRAAAKNMRLVETGDDETRDHERARG